MRWSANLLRMWGDPRPLIRTLDRLLARSIECLALGMVTLWVPDKGHLVASDSLCRLPAADLNRFITEGWYRFFWIKPTMSRNERETTVH